MITEVVDDSGAVSARASEHARAMAAGPSTALGRTRLLLRSAWDLDRVETGAEKADTITEMVRGTEAQMLISRFVGR